VVQKTLFPKSITREELNSLVDIAADIIRTATDYKITLVLLFLNESIGDENERGKTNIFNII
jgi:hypothetical protein